MARIIKNKLIPFEGYSALTMFQCIWVREKYYEKVLNSIRTQDHEGTHMKQELEIDITVLILTILSALILNTSWYWLLISPVAYLIIYVLNWFIQLLNPFKSKSAYRSNPMEKEAYYNQDNHEYNKNRKLYAWLGYIFKKAI